MFKKDFDRRHIKLGLWFNGKLAKDYDICFICTFGNGTDPEKLKGVKDHRTDNIRSSKYIEYFFLLDRILIVAKIMNFVKI